MRSRLLMLLSLTALWIPSVHAWTAVEIRAMPPYCAGRYAKNDNIQEYKRWEENYGPDFLHTHHLCDGIGFLNNLYKAKNPSERKMMLNEAMGGLNYMIQHAQPNFKLMPEVYFYRGQVLYLMDRKGEAVLDSRKAIELDPKLSKAYVQAAEYLERMGQKAEALKLVSEGLRHLPGNAGLQRLYMKLGGQQPFPEPYQQEDTGAKQGDSTAGATAEGARPKEKATSQEHTSAPNFAVFDFSKNVGAARHEPPIVGAGGHVFVEISEHPNARNKLLLKFKSRIPQPAARIMSIAIDPGAYGDLIANVEIHESLYKNVYKVTAATPHAYWPGLRPRFMASFSASDAKLYDPRALPPGGYLTLAVTLAPGKGFDDIVKAMREGLGSPNGLRIGIIAHHLMGRRPDPTKTIMDDAGFYTGSLRKLTGPHAKEDESSPSEQAPAAKSDAGPADTSAAASPEKPRFESGDRAAPAASTAPQIGTPTNPWCRFCPEQP
jgi:tetratricopeptide (TPR) repeat protein